MKGTNPIRKPIIDQGETLGVKAIFSTLQGEGPHAGRPAIFVRLGGCNLACSFCDTDFEDFSSMNVGDILSQIEALKTIETLVVITGGEPLRQNIALLCEALVAKNYQVQIETNGTLYRELPKEVEIVCSPKITNGGYHPVRADLARRVNAFKFLISAHENGYNAIPDVGQGTAPVYVQPMDEADEQKNRANLVLATQLALRHGHRLSLQLHKIVGIP